VKAAGHFAGAISTALQLACRRTTELAATSWRKRFFSRRGDQGHDVGVTSVAVRQAKTPKQAGGPRTIPRLANVRFASARECRPVHGGFEQRGDGDVVFGCSSGLAREGK